MGYRHYFYEVNKFEVEKIQDMTKEQIAAYMKETYPGKVDSDGYFSFRDIAGQKEIFEFGKLYYEDTAEQIYSTGKPLFSNPVTQEDYCDYAPYVVGKEGLLKAIEIYKSKVLSYYKSLMEDKKTKIVPLLGIEIPEEAPKENKWKEHILDITREWERGWVIDIDEKREAITTSWKYEYQIFELVRLLKFLNWDEKTILFYGW